MPDFGKNIMFMGWRRRALWWLRALFQREKLDADVNAELRFHLDMQTAANLESGMDPQEARYAASRRFGWIESIREACREQQGIRWLEDLLQDLGLASRPLRKAPAFTALAVVTLGLVIGSAAVVKRGARLAAAGLVLGPTVGWNLSRLVPGSMPLWSSLPADVMLAVSALLALVTWLACWPPAHRAARVDPMLALRYE